MHDETNTSLFLPTRGEDLEQSVMGESHADDSVHRSELVYFWLPAELLKILE